MLDKPSSSIANTRAHPQYNHIIKLILGAIVIGYVSFAAGKFVERRANVNIANLTNTKGDVKQQQAIRSQQNDSNSNQRDRKKCDDITELRGQISKVNWELITPYQEFIAGKLNSVELQQRTALPTLKVFRLCTQAHQLANEIENTYARARILSVTSAMLLRQRGFAMMIEGICNEDETCLIEGMKLFEEGRIKVLAATTTGVNSDDPDAVNLKRLLEAYKEVKYSH